MGASVGSTGSPQAAKDRSMSTAKSSAMHFFMVVPPFLGILKFIVSLFPWIVNEIVDKPSMDCYNHIELYKSDKWLFAAVLAH